MNIRGRAIGVASSANWGPNWLVALAFPVVLATLGGADAFRLVVALGIAASFFVHFRAPETKGKTLKEKEAGFRGVRVEPIRVK